MPMKNTKDIVAEASFSCSICNKFAGSIQLKGSKSSVQCTCKNFAGEMIVSFRDKIIIKKYSTALDSKDLNTLFSTDFETVPFYCPKCNACYCGDHYVTMPLFDPEESMYYDSLKGTCPQGHTRMLQD